MRQITVFAVGQKVRLLKHPGGLKSDPWSTEVRSCFSIGKTVTATIDRLDGATYGGDSAKLKEFTCEGKVILASWYVYASELSQLCAPLGPVKLEKLKPLDKRIRRWILKQRPTKRFQERRPELRALEGWQTLPNGMKIKISCRWNDMLRAVDSKHFGSCFKPDGAFAGEVFKRLTEHNNYAVAILQDKAGNVMGRSFFTWEQGKYDDKARLDFDPVIGNGDLKSEHLRLLFPEQTKARTFTINVLGSNRYYTR